jgi:hypothetical protein
MILPQSLKIEFSGEKLSLVLNEWVPYILMTGSDDRIYASSQVSQHII